jgi:Predicted membrane protein
MFKIVYNGCNMKRNTFYLLAGIVALAEVGIFWLSVELKRPILIQVAFVLGVLLIYLARRRVEERIEDERTAMITQKAALRTLEVFWVVFFVVSLGSAVVAFSRPLGLRPPHPGPPNTGPCRRARTPVRRRFCSLPDGAPLPDDLPVRGVQDVLRPQVWRMG